jgi:hypothetical protein
MVSLDWHRKQDHQLCKKLKQIEANLELRKTTVELAFDDNLRGPPEATVRVSSLALHIYTIALRLFE